MVQLKQDLQSLGVMEMADSWSVTIGSEEKVLLGVLKRSIECRESETRAATVEV